MGAAPTTGLDDARTAVARGGEAARSALATGRAGAEGEELGAWPARGLEGGDVQAGELALGGRIPKGWEGGRSRRCARAEGPRADDNGCVARELPPAADGTRVAEPGGGGGRRGGGGGAGRRGIAGERDDATAEEEDEVEAACWEAGRPERAVEGEVSPLLVWSSPAERTHSSSAGRRHSARPSMPSCSCWAGARVSSYNHAAPKVEERKEGSGRRTCCCSTPFWTAATHMSSTGRQCLRRPASSSARQLKKMRKGKRGGGVRLESGRRVLAACRSSDESAARGDGGPLFGRRRRTCSHGRLATPRRALARGRLECALMAGAAKVLGGCKWALCAESCAEGWGACGMRRAERTRGPLTRPAGSRQRKRACKKRGA